MAYTKQYELTGPYWNNDQDGTERVYVLDSSLFSSSDFFLLAEFYCQNNDSADEYNIYLTDIDDNFITTLFLDQSGVGNNPAPQQTTPLNCRVASGDTVDCSSGCKIKVNTDSINIGVTNISDSEVYNESTLVTPRVRIWTSDKIPAHPPSSGSLEIKPLMVYDDLNMIETIECDNTSTSSICQVNYSTTTSDFVNASIVFFIAIGFSLAAYLVFSFRKW